LYSLPDNVKDVNVTMGYPLKLSGVSTFVSLLRRLQAGRRKTGNRTGYYYKDLESVLAHPFSQMLFGGSVTLVKEWIREHHHAIVDMDEVSHISSELSRLLAPLPDESGPDEVVRWLDRLLQRVTETAHDSNHILFKTKVDVANIEYYRLVLKQMLEVVKEYKIDMQWRTFLSLTDRLISVETVPLEGQPLKGLQVMGMLETRALDFERIVIPSLNERILPSRKRVRTFISDSLRKAYGLPPVTYSESIFAYYFFRMIARAKEVVLLYDARSSDGARSGDISRYVLQLQYLYAKDRLKLESRTFDISKSDLKPSPIPKTEDIMKMLSSFTDPGANGRNLSATALSRFADCEIRFYFENVLGIRTDEESVDYIDAITQGSILHFVMENIYLPEDKQGCFLTEPKLIEPSLITSKMNDVTEIDRLIRIGINKLHFHRKGDKQNTPLSGSVAFVAKVFRSQILAILEFDLKQAPFHLYGVEIDGNVSLKMPVGKPLNMRFAIDRLDQVRIPGEKSDTKRLRIV
ncbi:MAG: PD-(D/E)XK nuclease family protein, partial [Muribaculaceae bacterium]|nr:PD-(D/E)XK nuclease family protein [Muribaculaceae bacterium]